MPPYPPFFGRKNELAALNGLWKKKKPSTSLVTCTGRRRIGKSRLIQEFGRRHATIFFEFQGLPPRKRQTNTDQLNHFGEKLASYMSLGAALEPKTWNQAFGLLAQLLLTTGSKRTVVLLDEISWMGARDKNFSGYLKDAWDTQLKNTPALTLVLSGSVSSWIEDHIIAQTGFHGRISLNIRLGELSLPDCQNIVWGRTTHSKKTGVSALEKIRLLSVTGGVPHYLEQIDPQASARDNIHRLCFKPSGALFHTAQGVDEFSSIFNTIFGRRSETYHQIVTHLATGHKTISQLSEKMKKSRSGYFTQALHELALTGFIAQDTPCLVGRNEGKISYYRLSDNYLRFYIKYMAPHHRSILNNQFKLALLDKVHPLGSILGLQFENLILNNQPEIHRILNIQSQVIRSGTYRQTATRQRRGCQIDLLIETDHSLYLCELKLQHDVKTKVINDVQEKAARLYIPRTKKHLNLFPVLIHAGELTPGITQSDFFTHIIHFDELLQ